MLEIEVIGVDGIAVDVPAAVELPREAWAESWAAEFVDGRRVCVLLSSFLQRWSNFEGGWRPGKEIVRA